MLTHGSTTHPPTTKRPTTIRLSDGNRQPDATLRVAYVGPNMDAFEAAYNPFHDRCDHSVQYIRSVGEITRLDLIPDVVVINPLVQTPIGIEGACAVGAIVPGTTVIVVIYNSLGSSHTMYTRHALGGRCHPRMLLHYPSPSLDGSDIVAEMDRLARRRGGGPQIRTTGHLPPGLVANGSLKDLGQVLSENADHSRSADDSLTYARLLYAASVNNNWSTWGELAAILGFAEGHVKNTKAKIGRTLTDEVLPDRPEVGVPRRSSRPKGSQAWRIAEFTRFVTEHRSFIRAYCQHHLDASV